GRGECAVPRRMRRTIGRLGGSIADPNGLRPSRWDRPLVGEWTLGPFVARARGARMRHLSVTRNANGERLRVLLIDETSADRAVVETAAGPEVAIAAASGDDVAARAVPTETAPDIALIGRRARRPGVLLRKL